MTKKLLAILLSVMLLLTACGGANNSANTENVASDDAGDSDTIKLGGIIPQTGPVSTYGNTSENGIKLAISEINEAGGIDGKQIEWISYDDKGDQTESVTAYNKLMEEDVDAIIGAITSKPTLAVAETAVQDGIPMITPTGTQENITEDKDNVFRVCFTDPYQGELLALYAKDTLNLEDVAILRNTSSDYSNGVADAFTSKAEELGMNVVADEGYGDTDTDFKAQLTNIQSANPEAVLIPDYYEKIALITPQAREAGIDCTFLGGDGWDGVLVTMDESSFKDIEQSFFTNHFSLEDDSEEVQTFIEAYQEEYGEDPSAFSALSYDAIYLYKQAVEEAGSTDYEAVIKAIKDIEFSGVTGSFTFDEDNNPIKSGTMIRIEDGQYKFDSIVDPNGGDDELEEADKEDNETNNNVEAETNANTDNNGNGEANENADSEETANAGLDDNENLENNSNENGN